MPWRSIELALCLDPGLTLELALVVEVEVNLLRVLVCES